MTTYTVTVLGTFLPTTQQMQTGFDVVLTPYSATPSLPDMAALAEAVFVTLITSMKNLTTISMAFDDIEVWHRSTNLKYRRSLGGSLGTSFGESDLGNIPVSFRKVIVPLNGMRSGGMRLFPPAEGFGTATGDVQSNAEQILVDNFINAYLALNNTGISPAGGTYKEIGLWVYKWVYNPGSGYVGVLAAPVADMKFIGTTSQNSRKNYLR